MSYTILIKYNIEHTIHGGVGLHVSDSKWQNNINRSTQLFLKINDKPFDKHCFNHVTKSCH